MSEAEAVTLRRDLTVTDRYELPDGAAPLVDQLVVGPSNWIRGSASFDPKTATIALDVTTIEEYVPMALELHRMRAGEPTFLFLLANLRTPSDAEGIASDYGLLRKGPGSKSFREPYVVWQRAARHLREIIELRDALRHGDVPEMKEMVAPYREHLPERNELGVRLSLEEQAAILIAGRVNDGLVGTEIRLLPGPLIVVDHERQGPTRFSYSPEIRDLEGYAFNDLAIVLSRSVDIAVCASPGCERIFRPKRAGQEYHDDKCAARERVRRYRAARR